MFVGLMVTGQVLMPPKQVRSGHGPARSPLADTVPNIAVAAAMAVGTAAVTAAVTAVATVAATAAADLGPGGMATPQTVATLVILAVTAVTMIIHTESATNGEHLTAPLVFPGHLYSILM